MPDPTPADRLLHLLKTQGPLPAAALATALGITGEAVRQQLQRLAGEGLVVAEPDPAAPARAVGRPRQRWRLTRAADARFPDAHAELATQLIRGVRDVLGEAALDALIAQRASESARAYADALADAPGLAERVARLAALRDREGYVAEWRPDGDGWLLIENHCPICAAATLCQGFCRAELQAFAEALGPGARIERVEHLVAGARRCAYRVTPAP